MKFLRKSHLEKFQSSYTFIRTFFFNTPKLFSLKSPERSSLENQICPGQEGKRIDVPRAATPSSRGLTK